MKDYIWFFILFTVLQLLLATGYFILVKNIDVTLIAGTAIYVGGMCCAFLACQAARYKLRRKELIENLF